MTLEIRQSCFPFFPCSLIHMAVLYILQLAPRKFLPYLVIGFEKSLWAQIWSKLFKSSETLSAMKCSYLGLQGQSRAFSSASSFSFTNERTQWQSLRETCFELWCSSHFLYFTFFPAKSADRGSRTFVPRLQPSWVQHKFLSGPVRELMLGWAQTGEQKSPQVVPRPCTTVGAQ